jgi:hypothetical protein
MKHGVELRGRLCAFASPGAQLDPQHYPTTCCSLRALNLPAPSIEIVYVTGASPIAPSNSTLPPPPPIQRRSRMQRCHGALCHASVVPAAHASSGGLKARRSIRHTFLSRRRRINRRHAGAIQV